MPTKKDDLKLSELVELYRISQKSSVAMSTYKRNYYAANTLMRLLGESTLVSKLNAGYTKNKLLRGDKTTPTRFNQRLYHLKALLRWGYENDYIADISYLDKLKPLNDKEKKEKLLDKYLEASELKMLLDNLKLEKWKFLATLTVLSGMRCGEAIALTMDDIDFANKTIHINKNFDVINKIVTTPKTICSNRDIYMQPELEKLCEQIKKYTLDGKLKYGYETDLFMCDVNGEHLNYYSYNKYLSETAENVLDRRITTHVMRHTHVSLMAEAGVPLDVITRRVGHEDSDITKHIYLHITEKQKDREKIKDVKFL